MKQKKQKSACLRNARRVAAFRYKGNDWQATVKCGRDIARLQSLPPPVTLGKTIREATHTYPARRESIDFEQAALAALRRLAAGIAKRWQDYRRHRETRAIHDALVALDDRTLRDLGFHRCEIWSVAAEATGEAEWTRARKPLQPRTPR
jgi:uncharacterized protein YjiS (DUF1127 family)